MFRWPGGEADREHRRCREGGAQQRALWYFTQYGCDKYPLRRRSIVAVQSKPVRPRAPTPPRRAAAAVSPTRRRGRHGGTPATQRAVHVAGDRAAVTAGGPSRGDYLFLVFFLATMIMVIAVVLVGAVGQMWVLVPVMLVDLTVTFAVIATLVSLLGDDGRPSA
jgi:hypothetical protein